MIIASLLLMMQATPLSIPDLTTRDGNDIVNYDSQIMDFTEDGIEILYTPVEPKVIVTGPFLINRRMIIVPFDNSQADLPGITNTTPSIDYVQPLAIQNKRTGIVTVFPEITEDISGVVVAAQSSAIDQYQIEQ